MLTTDRDARITAWTPAAQKLLGFSAEQVLGKRFFEAMEARDTFGNRVCARGCAIADMVLAGEPVRTFEMLGVEPQEGTVRAMVRRYEELLPASLPLKRGSVLPNVREILEHLESRTDVRSYLLTGNTRGGARAKLTYYGLIDFFADGAFAEDDGDRSSIARRALTLARQEAPVADDGVFVIGDTPHDIECAKAIGARTIAVATGGYEMEELQAHGPWRIFKALPACEEFASLIRRASPS